MANRLDQIVQERMQKLERIRATGIEPYPHRYQRTHTMQDAVASLEGGGGNGCG
ncbi:hypothetical protein ACFLYF_04060 [Chloroflexota bacterium]